MPSVELTKNKLAALLREAADAHAIYEEEELGHPDETWAEWYAEYIMDELGADEQEADLDEDVDVIGG